MSDEEENNNNKAHIRFSIGTAATGGALSFVQPNIPKTHEEWNQFDNVCDELLRRNNNLQTRYAAQKINR